MKITYIPSKDELILKIYPIKRKRPSKKAGPLKFWWDNEGNILAIAIANYTEELQKWRNNIIQLEGIWKHVKITEKHIKEARKELLRKVEGKW